MYLSKNHIPHTSFRFIARRLDRLRDYFADRLASTATQEGPLARLARVHEPGRLLGRARRPRTSACCSHWFMVALIPLAGP